MLPGCSLKRFSRITLNTSTVRCTFLHHYISPRVSGCELLRVCGLVRASDFHCTAAGLAGWEVSLPLGEFIWIPYMARGRVEAHVHRRIPLQASLLNLDLLPHTLHTSTTVQLSLYNMPLDCIPIYSADLHFYYKYYFWHLFFCNMWCSSRILYFERTPERINKNAFIWVLLGHFEA